MKLLYVDTSALFKRYVEEDESDAMLARMEGAPTVGTALITRVEVAAALAKAVREQRMNQDAAEEAQREFLDEWVDFTRIGVTDALAARAGNLAWGNTGCGATTLRSSQQPWCGKRQPKTRKTRSCSRASTTSCAKQRRRKVSKRGQNEARKWQRV